MANPYAGLTDSELDNAYAAYYDAHDAVDAGVLADEIIQRQASVLSFGEGLLGIERFPQYTARTQNVTGFSQVGTAQNAVAKSAGDVVASVKAGATGLLAKIGFGGGIVLGVATLTVLGYVFLKAKK